MKFGLEFLSFERERERELERETAMYRRNCVLYKTLIIKFLEFLFSTFTNHY